MPLTQERTFQVRYYECDANGFVNQANYFRYMQEVAFDASATAGYGVDRYQEIGQTWLVRETDVTFLQPLAYGDSVSVKTWVVDFRRVRSRRAYEMRKVGTGEKVAQAMTDWVFLDSKTFRPSTVPPEMIAAFWPNGPPKSIPPREPFPKAPPVLTGAFTLTRQAEWRDLDQVQHVNNASYIAYFDDCGIQCLQYFGWPMNKMMESGFGIIPLRYRIEYRQAALFDDQLEITAWLSDVKESTALRHYTLHRLPDRVLLARANVLSAWVDPDSRRPVPISASFLNDLAPCIAV